MDYLSEVQAFENWKRCNSAIKKSDICLWYALMAIANRFNWQEFTVPISTLILESRLNQSAIYRARNKLKQRGLIDFKEPGGDQPAIYKMNSVISMPGNDYILLTEGFQNWLEANNSAAAHRVPFITQLLFFKLIHLFKLSDWSEWIQMTQLEMMMHLQISNPVCFCGAKKMLIEEGLIIYSKGKRGIPSKYKLNDKMDFIREAKITQPEENHEK